MSSSPVLHRRACSVDSLGESMGARRMSLATSAAASPQGIGANGFFNAVGTPSPWQSSPSAASAVEAAALAAQQQRQLAHQSPYSSHSFFAAHDADAATTNPIGSVNLAASPAAAAMSMSSTGVFAPMLLDEFQSESTSSWMNGGGGGGSHRRRGSATAAALAAALAPPTPVLAPSMTGAPATSLLLSSPSSSAAAALLNSSPRPASTTATTTAAAAGGSAAVRASGRKRAASLLARESRASMALMDEVSEDNEESTGVDETGDDESEEEEEEEEEACSVQSNEDAGSSRKQPKFQSARPSALAVAALASSTARKAAAAAAGEASPNSEDEIVKLDTDVEEAGEANYSKNGEEEEEVEEEVESASEATDESVSDASDDLPKKRGGGGSKSKRPSAAAAAASTSSSGRARTAPQAAKPRRGIKQVRGSQPNTPKATVASSSSKKKSSKKPRSDDDSAADSDHTSSSASPAAGSSPNASGGVGDCSLSPMECGRVRSDGVRVFEEHIPFFGTSVELYTATLDPQQRVLVRASTLAARFNCQQQHQHDTFAYGASTNLQLAFIRSSVCCFFVFVSFLFCLAPGATNKVGMYLSRRRLVSDGLFQAASFAYKPAGRTGLKSGGYFLSHEVCLAFEAHYSKHTERHEDRLAAAAAAANAVAASASPSVSVAKRVAASKLRGGRSTPSDSLSPATGSGENSYSKTIQALPSASALTAPWPVSSSVAALPSSSLPTTPTAAANAVLTPSSTVSTPSARKRKVGSAAAAAAGVKKEEVVVKSEESIEKKQRVSPIVASKDQRHAESTPAMYRPLQVALKDEPSTAPAPAVVASGRPTHTRGQPSVHLLLPSSSLHHQPIISLQQHPGAMQQQQQQVSGPCASPRRVQEIRGEFMGLESPTMPGLMMINGGGSMMQSQQHQHQMYQTQSNQQQQQQHVSRPASAASFRSGGVTGTNSQVVTPRLDQSGAASPGYHYTNNNGNNAHGHGRFSQAFNNQDIHGLGIGMALDEYGHLYARHPSSSSSSLQPSQQLQQQQVQPQQPMYHLQAPQQSHQHTSLPSSRGHSPPRELSSSYYSNGTMMYRQPSASSQSQPPYQQQQQSQQQLTFADSLPPHPYQQPHDQSLASLNLSKESIIALQAKVEQALQSLQAAQQQQQQQQQQSSNTSEFAPSTSYGDLLSN